MIMKRAKTNETRKKIRLFFMILVYLFVASPSIALDTDSIYKEIDKIYSSGVMKSLYDTYIENRKLGNKIDELFFVYNIMDKTNGFDLSKKCAVYQISPIFSTGPENLILIVADNTVKIFIQGPKYTDSILREIYTLKKEHPNEISEKQFESCLEYVIYQDGFEHTRFKSDIVLFSSGNFRYYFYPNIPAKDLAVGFNRLLRYYYKKSGYDITDEDDEWINDQTAEYDYIIKNSLLDEPCDINFEDINQDNGIYYINHKKMDDQKYILICHNYQLAAYNTSFSKETAYDAVAYLLSLMSKDPMFISNDQFKKIATRIITESRFFSDINILYFPNLPFLKDSRK